MKRSIDYVLKDMGQMESFLSRRDVKYRRNFNRYYNNGARLEDIHNIYSANVLAFYQVQDEILGNIPRLNILRSVVDTTTSKLAQTKVRPFFNPVLGNYKTVKTCRQAQIYFDEIYESQKVYQKAINAFKDALVFDIGVLWIDDETSQIKKVEPWDFMFDVGEMTQGKLTRCELRRRQYPLSYLEDKLPKNSSFMDSLESTPNAFVDYRIYWDLINKVQYHFIGTELIEQRKISYNIPPFVWIYYCDPVKGAFSDSMIDVIYQTQKMIDDLTYKISSAASLSPANLIFVPRGGDIKASMIAAAKIGDVFEYNQSSTGNPVTVAAPPVIDPMYIQLLEMFEQKAYNMVGVSQLSAQSKKPSGLNSGVALQTVEDVESERHEILLNNYTRFVRDVAEKIIAIFPDNAEVLPNRRARSAVKWADVRKERDMFNIQYSSASSLSKDPKVKMEQIEKLISMKVIDPSIAATLLEMPDLEQAYAITTAAYEYNEKIIERVIEDGPNPITNLYNFYEITNLQGLFNQAVNTLMRLDTNDEKPEVLNNLAQFINQLKDMMDEINAEFMQPQVPVPTQQTPPPVQQ